MTVFECAENEVRGVIVVGVIDIKVILVVTVVAVWSVDELDGETSAETEWRRWRARRRQLGYERIHTPSATKLIDISSQISSEMRLSSGAIHRDEIGRTSLNMHRSSRSTIKYRYYNEWLNLVGNLWIIILYCNCLGTCPVVPTIDVFRRSLSLILLFNRVHIFSSFLNFLNYHDNGYLYTWKTVVS